MSENAHETHKHEKQDQIQIDANISFRDTKSLTKSVIGLRTDASSNYRPAHESQANGTMVPPVLHSENLGKNSNLQTFILRHSVEQPVSPLRLLRS
jgi:hypothetical protein